MAYGLGLIAREWHHRYPYRGAIGNGEYRRLLKMSNLQAGSLTLFGTPVKFSAREGVLHSIHEIFFEEVYKFNARTTAPYIIDAGANIGLSCIYFKRLYPDARIVAYEPDHAIFSVLKANTARYSDIELHESAVWVEDGELTFYSEGSLAGSSEIDFRQSAKPTTVKAERLKDKLRGERVDFLKIDIEGAENSVLFDIEEELANVDHLFFEYHSQPGKPQQLGELLTLVRKAGFRVSINGAHGARLPFVDTVEQGFDLQLNVFCLRDAS